MCIAEMRKTQEDFEERLPHQVGCREQMRKSNSYKMVKVPLELLGSGTDTLWSLFFWLKPTHDSVSFLQIRSSRMFVLMVAICFGCSFSGVYVLQCTTELSRRRRCLRWPWMLSYGNFLFYRWNCDSSRVWVCKGNLRRRSCSLLQDCRVFGLHSRFWSYG